MAVKFLVECTETRPGDSVFVAGSHDALGNFNPKEALQLTTTAEAFPMWCSGPVELPSGMAVTFKYIIQKEDQTGSEVWETLRETNRSITPVEGKLQTAKAKWGNSDVQISTLDLPRTLAAASNGSLKQTTSIKSAKSTEELMQERTDIERTDMAIAEYSAESAADKARTDSEVGSKLMSREPMRRNFSQSLFDAMEEEEGAETADALGAAEAGGADGVASSPLERSESLRSKRGASKQMLPEGVNLKHIASFSALSTMLDAEEKDEVRTHRKVYEPQYQGYNTNVPVVVVTSEFAPFSKTGGLGLVAASYGYEFPRRGHRTMVISPKYKHYEDINYVGEIRVLINNQEELVKYWHRTLSSSPGITCDCIFVEHPSLQRNGGLYSGDDGREYPDNLFRFTLLSLAAMEAPLVLTLNGSKYGDKVIFLANDWQAGLVPVYMNFKYRANGVYMQARTIYVIHNMGYQGAYPGVNACSFLGVPDRAAHSLAFGNTVNLSKGGLVNADRVLTVSPNYANEIQTSGGGFGLQDFVRAKGHCMRLTGILNGIDDGWNPATDTNIRFNFSVDNVWEMKAENKKALQERLGLHTNPGCVLIGFVGRLSWQKGVDMIGAIIDWLMEDTGNGVTGNAQLVMMGNGEKKYAEVLTSAENRFRGRVCGWVGFDPKVEHEIMAGCDLFLMPSRYEPCGLPQMICQQYATLPIVTATGGLLDSVKDVSVGVEAATGFHIAPLEPSKMKEVVYKAADMVLHQKDNFRQMQLNAMNSDYSWPKAMDEYERHIDYTLQDPPATYN